MDTLHKKNLLLLGEDRYLTALMLRTFPKRKQIFVPLAVCKTIVPDTFQVFLSQRRRWINGTLHNLMELIFIRDLCGTFCFSMQVSLLPCITPLTCSSSSLLNWSEAVYYPLQLHLHYTLSSFRSCVDRFLLYHSVFSLSFLDCPQF